MKFSQIKTFLAENIFMKCKFYIYILVDTSIRVGFIKRIS